jgi:exoribonuclease R
MQKQGLLKSIIKRRNSFDISFLKEKLDKLHSQDQTLVKIESCPNNFFDLVRHVYESFKEITQRATAIEVLCNEMLKYLDPGNSKVQK